LPLLADGRRRLALTLLEAALARVEGRRCVREVLRPAPPSQLATSASPAVWVAAVGKAAASMVLGAKDALGAQLTRILLITKDGHVDREARGLPGVEILESAHPVPDERSLAAGERLLQWVRELAREVTPLFLISGGASSLVEVPEAGVSLEDLARLNAEGLAEGIAIEALNARRAQLSRIKGGRLTACLRGRPAQALFLSDVPGDDPAIIGSGLLGPAAEGPDAVKRLIVGSIEHGLEAAAAAARAAGLTASIVPHRISGDATQLARRLIDALAASSAQVCLWGGESTVELPTEPGRGGRNQHLALAAARLIAGRRELLLLAAGTDGTDGPTQEAGALVDGGTWERLAAAGLDGEALLQRADSGTALAAAGDLIRTGPTGTNVGDLVIGLKLYRASSSGASRGGTASRVL
jgi:hydroxypyruvate reductase